MSAPLHIDRNGHRTWIKWHRGRRKASDPVFTGKRIIEAMQLGASVEVDLVVHGGAGFAVLHDLTLERETTGRGKVQAKSADDLRRLFLRDNDGHPIDQNVMLLEDLCNLLSRLGAHPDALLQLDFKQDLQALNPEVIANFAKCSFPVAKSLILSGGDFDAISVLAEAAPGIATGYDPCYGESLQRLQADGDYMRFIEEALNTAPDARMIYLDYRIVLHAEDAGVDLIAPVHASGRRVDAWTINQVSPQTIPQIERLLRLMVDQITTHDPEGLAKVFNP